MKKQFLGYLLIVLLIGFSCSESVREENQFRVNGTISQNDGWIKYSYPDSSETIVRDSAKIKRGQFTLQGYIDRPVPVTIFYEKNRVPLCIYVELADMTLTIDTAQSPIYTLIGSPTNDLHRKHQQMYEDYVSVFEQKKRALLELNQVILKTSDEKQKQSLTQQVKIGEEDLFAFNQFYSEHVQSFLKANPSALTLDLFTAWGDLPIDLQKEILQELPADLQKSKKGRILTDELERKSNSFVGNLIPDIEMRTIGNEPIRISNFKGKYLALFFWKTGGFMNDQALDRVIEWNKKLKSKGLEIISISYETNTEEFSKKIIEKGIENWKHVLGMVSPTKNRPDDVCSQLYIDVLPLCLLISPTGEIIGRWAGDWNYPDTPESKLNELFK